MEQPLYLCFTENENCCFNTFRKPVFLTECVRVFYSLFRSRARQNKKNSYLYLINPSFSGTIGPKYRDRKIVAQR